MLHLPTKKIFFNQSVTFQPFSILTNKKQLQFNRSAHDKDKQVKYGTI